MSRTEDRYRDLTKYTGRLLTDALELVQRRQLGLIERVRDLAGRYLPELPASPVSNLPLVAALPRPAPLARANFALAEALLKAQKRYTLAMLDAVASKPARKR